MGHACRLSLTRQSSASLEMEGGSGLTFRCMLHLRRLMHVTGVDKEASSGAGGPASASLSVPLAQGLSSALAAALDGCAPSDPGCRGVYRLCKRLKYL